MRNNANVWLEYKFDLEFFVLSNRKWKLLKLKASSGSEEKICSRALFHSQDPKGSEQRNFKGMKTPLSMSSHITSEGPHRGILVPFQNGSHVPTVFPYLFPRLTYLLTTFPHREHQHLVVRTFPKTSSCSPFPYVSFLLFSCSPKYPGRPSLMYSLSVIVWCWLISGWFWVHWSSTSQTYCEDGLWTVWEAILSTSTGMVPDLQRRGESRRIAGSLWASSGEFDLLLSSQGAV